MSNGESVIFNNWGLCCKKNARIKYRAVFVCRVVHFLYIVQYTFIKIWKTVEHSNVKVEPATVGKAF